MPRVRAVPGASASDQDTPISFPFPSLPLPKITERRDPVFIPKDYWDAQAVQPATTLDPSQPLGAGFALLDPTRHLNGMRGATFAATRVFGRPLEAWKTPMAAMLGYAYGFAGTEPGAALDAKRAASD